MRQLWMLKIAGQMLDISTRVDHPIYDYNIPGSTNQNSLKTITAIDLNDLKVR